MSALSRTHAISAWISTTASPGGVSRDGLLMKWTPGIEVSCNRPSKSIVDFASGST